MQREGKPPQGPPSGPRRSSSGAHNGPAVVQRTMDMTKFSTLIAMLLSASAGHPDEVQLFNGKDLDGSVAEGVKEFVNDCG